MFNFDSTTKIEALNYSALLNALNISEKKIRPLYDEFERNHIIDDFMYKKEVLNMYSSFFKVDKNILLDEYNRAFKAFLSLKESDEIIKLNSYDYPRMLSKTNEAPKFLYVRGKKSLLYETRAVALVGSRLASEQAKLDTKQLVDLLGKYGITIVSGLAKGIDVSAHIEALRKGVNTIAVIGTNLNQYYPNENKLTQLEIEKKGLIVSQFSPATKTQRWFFPLRNGVMSGLSLATVIMEAGETSGALKQADYALKQHRQVLIPRSSILNQKIKWPKKYIDKGAILFNDPYEVIEILANNDFFYHKYKNENIQMTLDDYVKNANIDNKVLKKLNDEFFTIEV